MGIKGYAFNEFDARTLQRVAKDYNLRSKYNNDIGRGIEPLGGLQMYVVILSASIDPASLNGTTGNWDMSYDTTETFFRLPTSSEQWSVDPNNTVVNASLVDTTYAVRVFNPSTTTAPADVPLLAIQDSLGGDLYLIIPGSGGSPTPTGVPFYNDSGITIPGYAPMVVQDYTIISGTKYLLAGQPGAGGTNPFFNRTWLVNGGSDVAPGGHSRGYWLFDDTTQPVLLGFVGTVLPDDELGPASGSWGLFKNRPGFRALSPLFTSALGSSVCLAQQRPVTRLYGKLYTDFTQNAAGTYSAEMEIWFRNGSGSPYHSEWNNITVYNMLLNKNEQAKKGTFGIADWYSDYWEGDFACDVDDKDTSGTNQSQNQPFGGAPLLGGGGGVNQSALLSGSTGFGTGFP